MEDRKNYDENRGSLTLLPVDCLNGATDCNTDAHTKLVIQQHNEVY